MPAVDSHSFVSEAPPPRIIEYPTTTPGASTLAYDPVSGTYSYVWKTDKAGALTGRVFTVTLDDGSVHSARF